MALFSEGLRSLKRYKIKNIVSLMQPCMVLSRLHGLFPFSYNITNMSISLSKPWYIASLIMMISYFVYAVVILYQIVVSGTLQYDNIPGNLQGICYVIICTFVGIVTLFLSDQRLSFLQDLFQMSANVPNKAFQTIGIFVHMKDFFGFIFLIGQIPNVYDKNIHVTLSKAFSLYATLVMFFEDALYMNIVLVLTLCFKNINENLTKLKSSVLTENQLHMTFFHERKNSLAVLKIQSIKKMHFAVSDTMQKLNITFSFQIVFSIILTFAEVTFSLYFYLLHTRSVKKINLEKQIWYSYFITSVTYYSVKLIGMLWACQLNKNETMLTGTLAHEILLNVEEPQLKDELQLFSLQILQRDNTLRARGISLDASLLTKLVGGITTYLLILIQFLVSSKNTCEDK